MTQAVHTFIYSVGLPLHASLFVLPSCCNGEMYKAVVGRVVCV